MPCPSQVTFSATLVCAPQTAVAETECRLPGPSQTYSHKHVYQHLQMILYTVKVERHGLQCFRLARSEWEYFVPVLRLCRLHFIVCEHMCWGRVYDLFTEARPPPGCAGPMGGSYAGSESSWLRGEMAWRGGACGVMLNVSL